MHNYQLEFIDLALSRAALRFGNFTLKSGRESPYFFNAGLFSDGAAASVLGRCYAGALVASGLQYDMLFGPAITAATFPTPSIARSPRTTVKAGPSSGRRSRAGW